MAKRRTYKDVAERIVAAMTEWNAAVAEAAEHPQVRVHMKYPKSDIPPLQYGCEVTRITKHAVEMEGDITKTFQWRTKIIEKPAKKGKKAKKPKNEARKAV